MLKINLEDSSEVPELYPPDFSVLMNNILKQNGMTAYWIGFLYPQEGIMEYPYIQRMPKRKYETGLTPKTINEKPYRTGIQTYDLWSEREDDKNALYCCDDYMLFRKNKTYELAMWMERFGGQVRSDKEIANHVDIDCDAVPAIYEFFYCFSKLDDIQNKVIPLTYFCGGRCNPVEIDYLIIQFHEEAYPPYGAYSENAIDRCYITNQYFSLECDIPKDEFLKEIIKSLFPKGIKHISK
ncbi:MAG: hypothetical protein KAT28_03220 [Candidatus Aenigmarchaeota archaeon]|nr:hypothetical protein [Candidatus Aenigmarchaeota archaeon]